MFTGAAAAKAPIGGVAQTCGQRVVTVVEYAYVQTVAGTATACSQL
jgi:hypothetical protein